MIPLQIHDLNFLGRVFLILVSIWYERNVFPLLLFVAAI